MNKGKVGDSRLAHGTLMTALLPPTAITPVLFVNVLYMCLVCWYRWRVWLTEDVSWWR